MDESTTYRDAGVDIDAGNEAVRLIKNILAGTSRTVPGGGEVGGVGGFSGLFKPALEGMEEPLLVASTDGVGTKLLLALEHDRLDSVGQDLVAMCVNDLIVCGARPLFFLDYIATAKLQPGEIERIVRSVNAACVESDCLLIGGETAEMPGMYAPGHTDLAGFAVGIVDAPMVIDGIVVKKGDAVIGLASSGLHSNGFSLVRKVIEKEGWKCDEKLPGCDEILIDTVLTPTRLYVRSVMALIDKLGVGDVGVKACAHITGGGLLENAARMIPKSLAVWIEAKTWKEHAIFGIIRDAARLPQEEMYRTFNCGIGFVVVVDKENADEAISILEEAGEMVHRIGEIIEPVDGKHAVVIEG